VHAATSIVRPLRDIHFPGICPLRTRSDAPRTDKSISTTQNNFPPPSSFCQAPTKNIALDGKRCVQVGTWRQGGSGSQAPGKNIPYGTLYPKTPGRPRSRRVYLNRLHRARDHLNCKATQRHPFPRYMPPTHMLWCNPQRQTHLDQCTNHSLPNTTWVTILRHHCDPPD